jgi:hypothetical protein
MNSPKTQIKSTTTSHGEEPRARSFLNRAFVRPSRIPHKDWLATEEGAGRPTNISTEVLKEFEILHKQIEETMKQVSTIEVWATGGIAAVWAFIVQNEANHAAHLTPAAWGIPFFLAFAATLKIIDLYYDYGVMSDFIFDKLEPKCELRWESYTLAVGNHLWGRSIFPALLCSGWLIVTFIVWGWATHWRFFV